MTTAKDVIGGYFFPCREEVKSVGSQESKGIVTELNDSIDTVYNSLEYIHVKVEEIITKLGLYGLPEDGQGYAGEVSQGLQYSLHTSNKNKYMARNINDLLSHIISQL